MAAPSRFPNGITNVGTTADTYQMPFADPTRYHMVFDDFDWYFDSTNVWTVTATSAGSGTSAFSTIDADGGVVRLSTAGNESDGAFAELGTGENFTIESGKKAWVKARFRLGDATESDFIIGLHSSDTTPLDATLRFAFIAESDGNLVFNVDDDTTDVDSDTVVALEDDTWTVVCAYWDGKGRIELFANDVKVAAMNAVDVPAGEMALGFGALNGASGEQDVDFDYILVAKER